MSFDDLISAAEAQRSSGLPLTLSLCVSPFPQMIRPDQGRRSASLSCSQFSLSLTSICRSSLCPSVLPRHNSQKSRYQTVVADFNWASGEFMRCSSSSAPLSLIPLTSLQSRRRRKSEGRKGVRREVQGRRRGEGGRRERWLRCWQ